MISFFHLSLLLFFQFSLFAYIFAYWLFCLHCYWAVFFSSLNFSIIRMIYFLELDDSLIDYLLLSISWL